MEVQQRHAFKNIVCKTNDDRMHKKPSRFQLYNKRQNMGARLHDKCADDPCMWLL